ncbi:hypothetical protein WDU94_004101 [Cyamophila willieti]
MVHLSIAIDDPVKDKSSDKMSFVEKRMSLAEKIRNKIKEFDEHHEGIFSRIQKNNTSLFDDIIRFRKQMRMKKAFDEKIIRITPRTRTHLMNKAAALAATSKTDLKISSVALLDKTTGNPGYRLPQAKAKDVSNNLARPANSPTPTNVPFGVTTPKLGRQVPSVHKGILIKIFKKTLTTPNVTSTSPPTDPPSTNGSLEAKRLAGERLRYLMRLVNELVSLRRRYHYIKKITTARITTLETHKKKEVISAKEKVQSNVNVKKIKTLNVESMRDIQRLLGNDSEFSLFKNRHDTKV